MQKNAPLAYASMRQKIRRTKTRTKMTPDAANACPRDENGTTENPQKIMGPRWGRLRGPRAVPNGLLKVSLFRRLVNTMGSGGVRGDALRVHQCPPRLGILLLWTLPAATKNSCPDIAGSAGNQKHANKK
jgi:hypothetical protein